MTRFIFAAWLAVILPARVQADAGKTNSVPWPAPNYVSQTTNAATQALRDYRLLVTGQNYSGIGFKGTNELAKATLGEPMIVFMVRVDHLSVYHTNDHPTNLLVDLHKVIYPVLVDGEARTSLTIGRLKNGWPASMFEKYRWGAKGFGRPGLLRAMERIRRQSSEATHLPLSSYAAVDVPGLNLHFIGHLEQNKLMLTSLFHEPGLNIPGAQALPAEKIFALLASIVKDYPRPDRASTVPGK